MINDRLSESWLVEKRFNKREVMGRFKYFARCRDTSGGRSTGGSWLMAMTGTTARG